MKKYLPSKKFILTVLSIGLSVGIIYFTLALKNQPLLTGNSSKQIKIESGVAKLETNSPDSDSDGLKDWEENLWGTDSKNPDTDGDGTQDGFEVKANRDPMKANTAGKDKSPNDTLEDKKIIDQKKAEADFNNLPVTEKISRELFLQYLKLGPVDSKLTDMEAQTIVDQALKYLPAITYKTYLQNEIKITNATDNETVKNYVNAVAKIILDNLMTKTEDVDTIIADTANIDNDTKLTEETKIIFQRFDPLIVKNKKSVFDLLQLTVPTTFVTEHLTLLNAFEEIAEKQALMQKSADDLAVLVLVKSRYPASTLKLSDAIALTAARVYDSDITFNNRLDYGYQLFGVIILGN